MSTECDELRRRIERALGWEEGSSNCFSLPTLREFVREKPKLYDIATEAIRSGRHITGRV